MTLVSARSLLALALLGCGASPTAEPASAERSLELTHESCDLESGSAQRTDVNGDGQPDIVKVMSGGQEVCRAIDLNFDGVKDSFLYFQGGQLRRRESDFDRDGIIDEIATYKLGQLLSKELETNFDKKLDTWEFYANGRIAKAERDSDGDGLVDEWWDFNRPDQPLCAIVTSDRNTDGEADADSAVDMCGEGYKPPPEPTRATNPSTGMPAGSGAVPPPPPPPAPLAPPPPAPQPSAGPTTTAPPTTVVAPPAPAPGK